jgi:cell division protein FtsW
VAAGVARMLRRPLASYHLVLGSAGLLLALGLVMVFSASSFTSQQAFGDPYRVFVRQLVFAGIGLVVGWLAARSKVRTVRRLSLPLLVTAVGLLALTYVPGFGVTVNGTRAWLDLGSELFRIQPSELAKLGLILWGASVLSRKGRLLRQWKHIAVPFLPMAAAVVALTVGQNDLGTSLILMSIVLTILWVLGVPTWFFGLAVGLATLMATYFVTAADHRRVRVSVFLDPWQDPDAAGYQSIHAIYAFAEGGWWGRGLGASSEKLGRLPEAHTDFIFAIIGEELGLPGTFVVLGLFGVLGYAGVRIAWRARDLFVRLAAAGLTGWLVVQALVNLGSVLGVLPIVGVPLPLVSYGGSALVPALAAVGLLLCFAKEEPGAKAALAARRRNRKEN